MLTPQIVRLFNELMALTAEPDSPFYFKDFVRDDITYRIFNYRLANYTAFTKPSALECRGTMFEMAGFVPVRLAARPMQKFFNINENPFTMNLDLSTVKHLMLKVDGSLISTYVHNDKLAVKTKMSLTSEQAVAAEALLKKPANVAFSEELYAITHAGYTVNMEYVAPTNRVVVGYMAEALIVLNVRNNKSGEYLPLEQVRIMGFHTIVDAWVEYVHPDDIPTFVTNIPKMDVVEGFVLVFENGLQVKSKTEWYLVQHKAKDSINSPRRLFEAVLEETTDDLRSLFAHDPLMVARIEEMEKLVDHAYNHFVSTVEAFYAANKALTRKDFAILGQKQLERYQFGMAMVLYTGKEPDYKDFMRRNYEMFGIKDEPATEEIE